MVRLVDIMEKLLTKPGRGGIHLSYVEAQLLHGALVRLERLERPPRQPMSKEDRLLVKGKLDRAARQRAANEARLETRARRAAA